jgi:D-tyrosyl-tRNA(Tyr) deacylase
MRACIQRVSRASVEVEGQVVGAIERGLLVLLGVTHADDAATANFMAEKVAGLRLFDDADGKMNLSVAEVGGSVLVVSQFTLYGDCRKGRRPSYIDAARPEQAELLYKVFIELLVARGLHVQSGIFRADMKVSLVNDGPVTIWLDSGDK